jgi:GAF domain-containing protein
MTGTDSFEADLTTILEQTCQAIGWQYGEVWIPDGDLLHCHPAHYLASPQLSLFREESEGFMFAAGAGLPGRVWLTQEPEWIDNVSLEPAIYYRAYIAKKVGLKAALGVPILASGAVLAVLIFYSDQAQPPTESLIATFSDQIRSLMAQYRFQGTA